MYRVREHLQIASGVYTEQIAVGLPDLRADLVFLHLRKALEEIAFSSLCANVEKYSKAHEDYASKWSANRLLQSIEKLNPEYYPVPIPFGATDERPHLTRDDFSFLYDLSSVLIHSPNPYNTGPLPDLKYSMIEWLTRFRNLLRTHAIRLVDDEEMWIVVVPDDGPIQVGRSRLVMAPLA